MTAHNYFIKATKRKVLTLEQKIQAIKLLVAGKAAYNVAEDLGVGKTQIQNLKLGTQCARNSQTHAIRHRK